MTEPQTPHIHHYIVGVGVILAGAILGTYLIIDDLLAHQKKGCPERTIADFVDCDAKTVATTPVRRVVVTPRPVVEPKEEVDENGNEPSADNYGL